MSEELFDLTRVRIRLEGLSSYGVVTALLLNASLRLWSSTPKKFDERNAENFVKVAFIVSVAATVVMGAHVTIVFSLLGIYAKTALGHGKDKEFLTFMSATDSFRQSAFYAFIMTLVCFMLSFILSLYLSFEEKRFRWWLTVVTGVVVSVSMQHMAQIIFLSSEILFG